MDTETDSLSEEALDLLRKLDNKLDILLYLARNAAGVRRRRSRAVRESVARDEAVEWIRARVCNEEGIRASVIVPECIGVLGISRSTLEKAKKVVSIYSRFSDGAWRWYSSRVIYHNQKRIIL